MISPHSEDQKCIIYLSLEPGLWLRVLIIFLDGVVLALNRKGMGFTFLPLSWPWFEDYYYFLKANHFDFIYVFFIKLHICFLTRPILQYCPW